MADNQHVPEIAGDATSISSDDSSDHPTRIGPYRILQVLGEGGMGVVYEAEQLEPVKRRVALKVLKLGMDTKEVVARFEAERQALAVMDHPSIAKVFDAGATENGRPYFVMEHVHGVPITDYGDMHKLSTQERLELFVPVCQAIQHAHQKGVIHRDLKPSNVLVTEQGGAPVPKIIDFGIAKATGQRLTEKTLVTAYGQPMGTPAYMSPEQAEMSGLDVDTRTDIYSLGVMLYEMLVGRLPLDPTEVGLSVFVARLAMRETDPPTPSARFVGLGRDQRVVAAFRHTDPGALRRELKGDLDWIVMKAMDPDRTRRYETASGLALDIQRHLRHEPVLARPPSARYRAGKFVRRNKAAVTAAVVMLAALVSGVVLATAGMVRARRAEQRAETEAEAVRQVSDFLTGLFQVSDPSEARGNTITARELLDEAAKRIETELADQPEVQATLMLTMGEVYQSLGLYRQAGPMLEGALAIREDAYGTDHVAVAEGLAKLAGLFSHQGRYEEAERLFRRAVTIQETRLGTTHAALAATLNGLGNTYSAQGKFDQAEPILNRALSIRETALAPGDPAMAASLSALGSLYTRQGRYLDADSMFTRALAVRERAYGPDHPDVAYTLANLGGVRWFQGNLTDAEQFFRRSLEIRTRMLGPDHPELADILNNLGVLAWTRGEYREAGALYARALGIYERALGPEHLLVASALNNIAETHWKLRTFAEGERLFKRALAIKERILEPRHPSLAITLNGLANLYRDQGRYGEAEPLYRRALAIRESALQPSDRAIVETLEDLAQLLRQVNRSAEAQALEARARRLRGDGPAN